MQNCRQETHSGETVPDDGAPGPALRSHVSVVRNLLVGDDDDIAEPLIVGLEREGFDVSYVSTAVGAVSAPVPDLVLLDLGLPSRGALAAERDVSLIDTIGRVPFTDTHVSALACPGLLEQVLDNLLANAIDATPPGGSVSLGAERRSGKAVVHVIDTGRGMTPSDRKCAFDRFWRPE